jgi:hypothetical protein
MTDIFATNDINLSTILITINDFKELEPPVTLKNDVKISCGPNA